MDKVWVIGQNVDNNSSRYKNAHIVGCHEFWWLKRFALASLLFFSVCADAVIIRNLQYSSQEPKYTDGRWFNSAEAACNVANPARTHEYPESPSSLGAYRIEVGVDDSSMFCRGEIRRKSDGSLVGVDNVGLQSHLKACPSDSVEAGVSEFLCSRR